MGSVSSPAQVTIVQKDGECKVHITLDININVNQVGVNVAIPEPKKEIEQEEKPLWSIPEFSKAEKIKFGNKKEG